MNGLVIRGHRQRGWLGLSAHGRCRRYSLCQLDMRIAAPGDMDNVRVC